MHRIAVIGAGVTGLSCARVLRQAGCFVEVYERERIIGGRLSTARLGLTTFDHGAQYITARSPRFSAYMDEMIATSYAAEWTPRGEDGQPATQMSPWFVGTPNMGSIIRPLAEGVRIENNKTVHTIQRDEKGWHLWFEDGTSEGPFAAVALAVPAAQARLLLGPVREMSEQLGKVRMSPCWAVLVRCEETCFPDQDVYSDMSEVIRWIGRNNAKHGRNGTGDHIVIHASPKWSRETEDAEPQVVALEIWEEVSHILGLPPIRPSQMSAFLWRHGLVETSLGDSFIFSSEHMVGCAGDWCLGRLVEHGFESGNGLGRAMANALF